MKKNALILLMVWSLWPGVCRGGDIVWLENMRLSHFIFQGNTVFSDDQLRLEAAPWKGQKITPETLEGLRRRMTLFYTDRGYINSGALIAALNPEQQSVTVTIIEGKLVRTQVLVTGRLKEKYISSRLKRATETDRPFNINRLNERLQLIKRDPRVKRINGRVSPGLIPGEATLDITAEAANPVSVSMKLNNYGAPAIGASKGEISLEHNNLTGWGDALKATLKKTEGSTGLSFRHTTPLTRHNASLSVHYSQTDVALVSIPFDEFYIKSRVDVMGLELRRPFYISLKRSVSGGLRLKKIDVKTYLLGEPFSFGAHPDDSEFSVTELSFFQEWVETNGASIFLAKSDFRLGLGWFGATIHREKNANYPDSRYLSWVGQIQWIKPLETFQSLFLLKTKLQLSNDSLMPVGKFSAGGASTVRGYREGRISGDNGRFLSLEWQIPVFDLKIPGISEKPGDGQMSVCPFFDYGKAWNASAPDPEIKEIASVGAGLRWVINEKINARVYWGRSLKRMEPSSEFNHLQDNGIHFQLATRIF